MHSRCRRRPAASRWGCRRWGCPRPGERRARAMHSGGRRTHRYGPCSGVVRACGGRRRGGRPIRWLAPPSFSSASPSLSLCPPPALRPRRAQHTVRSGCCASRQPVCLPVRLAVWLRLFTGARAGTDGSSKVVAAVFSRSPRSRRRAARCRWRRRSTASSGHLPGQGRQTIF